VVRLQWEHRAMASSFRYCEMVQQSSRSWPMPPDHKSVVPPYSSRPNRHFPGIFSMMSLIMNSFNFTNRDPWVAVNFRIAGDFR
jgi:hypothetical protein